MTTCPHGETCPYPRCWWRSRHGGIAEAKTARPSHLTVDYSAWGSRELHDRSIYGATSTPAKAGPPCVTDPPPAVASTSVRPELKEAVALAVEAAGIDLNLRGVQVVWVRLDGAEGYGYTHAGAPSTIYLDADVTDSPEEALKTALHELAHLEQRRRRGWDDGELGRWDDEEGAERYARGVMEILQQFRARDEWKAHLGNGRVQ